MGAVDDFLGVYAETPSLRFLQDYIRMKASTTVGIIGPMMTLRSLSSYIETLLSMISRTMKRVLPRNYRTELYGFLDDILQPELRLSTEKYLKPTSTPEELDRFLRRVLKTPLLETFASARDVFNYLLFLNLYVDLGARGYVRSYPIDIWQMPILPRTTWYIINYPGKSIIDSP